MVIPAKSEAGSGTLWIASSPASRLSATRRRVSQSRTWRMAIATSQDRYAAGSLSAGRYRITRTNVSWTTSSTSACPRSARPTML
ncbi:hypothetical protein ONO86_02547 [Micromonospora noduli]|nr:hypothetical protein ONO86_02547 [Micromonospora noduli]